MDPLLYMNISQLKFFKKERKKRKGRHRECRDKIDIEIKHIIITPNTSGRRSMELKYQSA
jgi:hypothetical protein